jgi:esterase/lipase
MGKKSIYSVMIFTFLFVLIWLCTKLIPTLEKWTLKSSIPNSIAELEDYLQLKETKFKPKHGTEKFILFPSEQKTKSHLAFVYFHGFSATRGELSPVFEDIAKRMALPIFFTRFTGHGLGSEELGQAKYADWIQDAIEAYEIGKKLGSEIILACASTGCPLSLYLAYFFPDKIRALVMLSPNFAPFDSRAFLALGPLGPLFIQIFMGEYREYQPRNSKHAYFWTVKYRSRVLLEMITLVEAIKNLDFAQIKMPILTLYTPYDNVVNPREIEKNVRRFGSQVNQLISLPETREHVLAGDAMNPEMTSRVEQIINQFLQQLSNDSINL